MRQQRSWSPFWALWGVLVLLSACGADTAGQRSAQASFGEADPANTAHGLAVGFSAEGVELSASGARALMHPSRWGCDGALTEVGPSEPEVHGHQVEYRREGFVEWYVNDPRGVEQGFTLPAPPPCRAASGGEVVVELAIGGGLHARLAGGGERVELRDAAGKVVLGYSELYVTDAAGSVLPARLGAEGDRISIHVDDANAAYPVVIDPLIWTEQSKLLSGSKTAGEEFGTSVSVSGNTAIVGAPLNDEAGQDAGAAYVFVRSGDTWVLQQKLLPPVGSTSPRFGVSVAIEGDTAVVGARYDDESGQDAGAAYVFVRSGATWSLQQKLLASDNNPADYFGVSVALSGDTVVVGAHSVNIDATHNDAGAAYVFVRSSGTWTEQKKLLASDGKATEYFGGAVAIAGDTVVVGADQADSTGSKSGAAYVFVRAGVTWTEQQKLVPEDGAADHNFGWSVAVSGDTAIVGAYHDPARGTNAGSAYVFVRSGNTWSQQQKLLPDDVAAGDEFGKSIVIEGDTAVVGAHKSDNKGDDSGSAYVFVRSGVTWTLQQTLLASDGAADDHLGASVAIAGNTLVIGASKDDGSSTDAGSAYVWGDVCYNLANGAVCNDGNLCTSQDICQDGVCVGASPILCPDMDSCKEKGVCAPATGMCVQAQKLDYTPCPGGLCIAGGCEADPSASSSSATVSVGAGGGGAAASTSVSASASSASAASASAGAGGAGGAGGAPAEAADIHLRGGGCAYAMRSSPSPGARWLLVGLALAALRRRRSGRRLPSPTLDVV